MGPGRNRNWALCGLAVACGWSGIATVQPALADGPTIVHEIDLGRVHGYHIELDARRGPVNGHTGTPADRASRSRRAPEVRLRVSHGGARSIYSVPATVRAREIRLRSPLIRLTLRFEPGRDLAIEPWCGGTLIRTTSGAYVGSFRFRGESGYVKVARHRLLGERTLAPSTCGSRRPTAEVVGLPARRGLAAILHAHNVASSTHLYAFARDDGRGALYATNRGRRKEILIRRYAFARARGEGLWLAAGLDAATVGPLAPLFRGSAEFTAPDSWTGDLAVRFLGIGPEPLTGPGFVATLEPG